MKKKLYRSCLLVALSAMIVLSPCTLSVFLAYADEKEPVLKVAISDEESVVVERIAYHMLKRMGYKMVSKPSGMRTAVDELLRGDADMLAAQVGMLEVSNPELVKIPESYTTVSFDVYARDNSPWRINSWEDMAGLRVVTRWQNLYIADHLPDSIAEDMKVSEYQELWDTLANGDADICIMANPENAEKVAPKGLKKIASIDIQPVYMYLDQEYADMVPLFTKTLQDMERDGVIDAIKAGQFNKEEQIVLHISSYSSDMLWEREMIDGIRKGLDSEGSNRNLVYYNFNLNARRTQNVANKQLSLARSLRDTFIDKTPDVIIASDNDALEFVKENHINIFRGIPVVFCGINEFTPEMIFGMSDYAAGCTEVLSASATVQQMLSLYPKTKNIFVVNDYTSVGEKCRQSISFQVSKINTGVNITYNDNISFEEMLRLVESFDTDTLVLVGSYFRDANNRYLSETDIQKAIRKASKMPVFTVFSTGVGEGGFGGLLSSAKQQGMMGGNMAKQILEGTPVETIPIIYAGESVNQWVFDASIAKEFDIPIKNLPEGSILVNQKESIWKTNFADMTLISVIFLLMLMMIAGLLRRLKRERRQYEEQRDAEKKHGSIVGEEERTRIKNIARQTESMIQNTLLGFVVVAGDVIVESNRYCKRELGLEPGDDIKGLYKNPVIHEKIKREIEMQEFISGEVVPLNIPDGEARRHYMNFGRVEYGGKTGYLAFAIDVEEIERQKDYSRRSQDDLQKIIDALPSAMAIVGTSTYELEYANNEFLQVYGYMTMEEAKNFDFRTIIEQVFAKWQGSTVIFEYDSEFAREHGIHLKMFADQIVFRNKNCIVLIGQDISVETKNAEMLMHAAEKEKEANMLKGVFLANMSHEIRTPMNAIIGLAQLALMREQSDENSDLFSKISSSARNLLSIINDILDFSKIEAEKLDFVEEEFNLEDTITNAFLVAAERIEEKMVEILLEMDKEVPCYLYGDKIRLWQILKNVLDNAVKYTTQGRVVLKISIKSIDEERIKLVFQVSDTGMGMSPEQLQRLFMPFEQFHRDSTKKAGTGLGLSITKQLVELMNGDINVESAPGEGTKFFITIPFIRVANKMTIGEYAKQSINDGMERRRTVLIADKDEYSCKIMADILKIAGIDAVCVSEGAKAVKTAREYHRQGIPFGTVILDYMLKGDNGIKIAKQLDWDDNMTKLLLVTAHGKKKISEAELREAGFKDTIEKPFIVSTFLQKVCGIIPEKLQMTKEKRPDFTGSKVLLCEDNEINQEVAQGILESFHITTSIAENGAEAIRLLEKEEFDLVLMDISMPVMDGHEATVKIRNSKKPYENVPIVAMTANVMQDEVEQCLREGMNEHVEKPIDLVKFQNMLARYLPSI